MSASLVLTVVVSVVLVATGALKVVAVPDMRDRAAHLGYSVTAFRLVGALELAGVAGLWWGRQESEPLGVAAAVALLALLVGAVVSHVRVGDGVADVAPAVVVGGLLLALLVVGVGA